MPALVSDRFDCIMSSHVEDCNREKCHHGQFHILELALVRLLNEPKNETGFLMNRKMNRKMNRDSQ